MTLNEIVDNIKRARVYDVVAKTPLDHMTLISARFSNQIYSKREDQQAIFSFKIRGAYNKISGLLPEERGKGVISASAGNHAQGIAFSAARLGISATVIMPKTTPDIKVDAVQRLGSKVILHGNTYDDASAYAHELSIKTGAIYIHPYDDYDVIAGQGTVAREILEQSHTLPDAVFIPVGGGGLIAGMGAWIKHHHPQIQVIGVEPVDAPSMHHALASGERIMLSQVGTFADGVAVKQVGEKTFAISEQCVDEVILVTTDEICAAIKDIYDESRSIMEPAGAISLAGLKKYIEREHISDKTLITINSGANINFDRLRHVAERAEIGEQKEALFAVTIPERPGSFHEFCRLLGNRSITEFNYRYADDCYAHVFAGVQLKEGMKARQKILNTFINNGFPTVDLSDDELAKLHVRYMVGGRSPGLTDERLFRFEFPERPGALLRFLSLLGRQWNISLFHYRNHGSDYGRVLCGIQVPECESENLQAFIDNLGYIYGEETSNPAYQLFLTN